MRKQLFCTIILAILIPGMMSCKRNHYKVNVSSVSAGIEIKRLEKDLFGTDPEKIPSVVPELKKKYGSFLQLFSYVINTGDIGDPSFGDLLERFCTDKLNNEGYAEVMKQYPDIRPLESELEDAFRHYLWYFRGSKVPSVYTCITGFNNSIITGDSEIGIGLERYLGSDCEYYPRLEIYKYIAVRMNSWNIVPDCIYAWGVTEWLFDSIGYPSDNVLAEIIHEGKLKYFEKCLLPEVHDTILFGFTADQMKFCLNNEMQMWEYLVEHDLLFSSDQMVIRKLTGEAPFTSFFTKESPGRAAVWIGFRIVESYMMKNRNSDLKNLMKNPDIQGILGRAKYDPQ
jgi:hypothetical protein